MSTAQILKDNKGYILAEWVKRVRDSIPQAKDISHLYLINQVPIFIDNIIELISTSPFENKTIASAKEHGEQRTDLESYSLEEIVKEYEILFHVIIELFRNEDPILNEERTIICNSIFAGIRLAIDQFTKRRMSDLQSKVEFFDSLSQTIPDIIWMADEALEGVYFNQEWYKYTGFSEKQSLGQGWRNAIHPHDRHLWEEALKRFTLEGTPVKFEKRIKRHDGVFRHFLTRAVKQEEDTNNTHYWIGSCTDIEDHKVIMESLNREMEIRGKLMNALTHDLRNPLMVAQNMALLGLKHVQGQELATKYFHKIIESNHRVERMISDLLDASRVQAGHNLPIKTQQCALDVIIKDAIEDLALIYGDRIKIDKTEFIEGQWDGDGIRRVLDNLVTNAIKYVDPLKPVSVKLERKNHRAILSVHNFGKVLNEKEKQNLFNMFNRSSEAQTSGKKGWGIGLVIVKGIVESHEGEIHVTSVPKEGTTFAIELHIK